MEHSHNAAWLRTEVANARKIAPMTNTAITIQDVKRAIKKDEQLESSWK
jgi:hypothetical protein